MNFDFDNIPIIGENRVEHASGESPETTTPRFSLYEYADEWAFFNHGALFSFAGFDDPYKDPVSDWINQQPIPQPLYLKQAFEHKLLQGVTAPAYFGPRSRDTSWEQVVCGIRKEYWPGLLEYVSGVVAQDIMKKTYYQVFFGEVEIPDPGCVERFSVLRPGLPTIKLTLFCVESNKNRWEFRRPKNPVAPMFVAELPPREEVKQIAKALFRGDLEPMSNRPTAMTDPFVKEYQRVLREGPTIGDSVGQDVKDLFRGNRH